MRATGIAGDIAASLGEAGTWSAVGDDIVHLSLDETSPRRSQAIAAAFAPHAPTPGQELQETSSGDGWDGLVREDPFLRTRSSPRSAPRPR